MGGTTINVKFPVVEEGKDYVPHVKTYSFSSYGRATRIMGTKIPRIHHLMSDLAYRAFLIFEWSPKIIDIREAYPLLDVMETIDDKEGLRFDKFQDKKTGKQFVIATSFLITVKDPNGKIAYVARSIKSTSELKRNITIEKLEIERRYWQAKGVDWKIITDKQLDKQYAKNIEWVRETQLESQKKQETEKLSDELLYYIESSPDINLNVVLDEFDRDTKHNKGTSLLVFRNLIATRRISVDMKKKIDMSKKISEIIWTERLPQCN